MTAIDPTLSEGRPWFDCLAYLEEFCNPYPGVPYPLSTVAYGQILWTLTEAIGARAVLEIGIGPESMSGMIFAHSMATRGGGMIYSIDIETDRPKEIYKQKAAELLVDWRQSYGDSLTLVDTLPSNLQVDLLYVDGDHDLTHAYGDTVGYFKYLRPGGYLVIDDYPGCDGVVEARQKLKAEGWDFLHLSHHPPHSNGRLLLQKPRPETYNGRPI